MVTLTMLTITVLANINAYNLETGGISEPSNVFRVINNLVLLTVTVCVMLPNAITINEKSIPDSYLHLLRITFCFAVINSIIGYFAGQKKTITKTVVKSLTKEHVVKNEGILEIAESIKKSFRLEFPAISESFDPRTQIIENKENVCESVEIIYDHNTEAQNAFFEKVDSSEKGYIKLYEREKECCYSETDMLHCLPTSGMSFTTAQIHDLCKRYKNGEDVFPHDVKVIVFSKGLAEGCHNHEEDRIVFPCWIMEVEFDSGKVRMKISFYSYDPEE